VTAQHIEDGDEADVHLAALQAPRQGRWNIENQPDVRVGLEAGDQRPGIQERHHTKPKHGRYLPARFPSRATGV